MSEPRRVRNESGTEGTAKVCTCGDPDGTGVVHRIDGPCFVPVSSDYRLRLKAGNDDYIALQRKLTAAEQRAEQADSAIHLLRKTEDEKYAAEQSLAEAVRGRETALRDLRKAEQRAEVAESHCYKHGVRILKLNAERSKTAAQWLESYAELRTDYDRAKSAYKSARQRASRFREALDITNAEDAYIAIERAAEELESLADYVRLWCPGLLRMGLEEKRCYCDVADEASDRAAKLRGEK